MTIAVKRDPVLWEKSKKMVCKESGLCKHSARKMQAATLYYKKHGGTYEGPRSPVNKLHAWTEQKWTTSTGEPSRGKLRYLPKKAWSELTPDQIRRTNAAKKAGTARGQQWVKQPADVAEITSRFSAQYPWMPYEKAHSYEREAEEKGVSKVARGKNGFMRMYEKHGAKLRDVRVGSITWGAKRHNFISRHMAQYVKHPTYRRWLAFRMWAFDAGEAPKE